MEGDASSIHDWIFLAPGLLACAATIGIAAIVRWVWPRRYYPRFFAIVAAVTTVSALFILRVPGSGFGLGALMIVIVFLSFPAGDTVAGGDDGKNLAVPKGATSAAGALAWTLTLGVLIGVILTTSLVAAIIMPPAYILSWASASEPLFDRVQRALHPDERWVTQQSRERSASERAVHAEAELADANKRLADAQAALSQARDELGAATSNTVRGIRVTQGAGSRHANGAIYVGLELALPGSGYCITHASSDKVDEIARRLYVGEAISLASSRGTYRIVATGIAPATCTFDLVKD
jgi:hypothetical protein